jgi:DNA mismatch repair protein MutS
MDDGRFVPNDLSMEADTCLYIITGPNMGGKSTYCRSVALAFLMAQAGSFIPASSADLLIRDKLFARVGAGDDLRGGQSTFMMEMNEVAHILRNATDRSLVILDEVGRGTGTYDGMSVAWSVSQYLAARIKAKTLFATHYLELTELSGIYPGVKNLSLAVEEEGERIVFLHKIISGSASKSYGVHVAKLAGLPAEVIGGAASKLAELEKSGDTVADAASGEPAAMYSGSLGEKSGQLSIFADETSQNMNGSAQKAFAELRKKNLSHMTPIDALNYLYKLQRALD